jgi:hypothetical protein
MLNEQHIPISVGIVVNTEAQGIVNPFHSQYFKTEDVEIPGMSKQEFGAYHKVENAALKARVWSKRLAISFK